MTEADLRNQSIPLRSPSDFILRVMVIEYDRRQCVLRGLTDSRPLEPWRICSPEDFKAGRLGMLAHHAKDGETPRQTAKRVEEEQWARGKSKGRK